MRGYLAAWLLGLTACLSAAIGAAAETSLEFEVLRSPVSDPSVNTVTSGSLDSQFKPFDYRDPSHRTGSLWLKLGSGDGFRASAVPALTVRTGRYQNVQVFATRAGESTPLPRAWELPGFGGTHDTVFILPNGLTAGQPLYAHLDAPSSGREDLRFSLSMLDRTLATGAEHARMISLAFGALMAMALTALLTWFVLSDKLLLLYATMTALQAVYIAYLSGQGFEWPVLSYAAPLTSFAWNVPVALGGAASSLFIREIADLRRFSPRSYTLFGWLAVLFVLLAFSNVAKLFGFGKPVAVVGNLIFVASQVFTLIVAFRTWLRGSRAAGWFLIAWGLLESFGIVTAAYMLFATTDEAEYMLYYGLPLSMVAAAVVIALGVADRLREQRLALTEAQRHAQTDPLTGVLNRRSLIQRLEDACMRARTGGMPIALLFLDLDHFKEINDSFGHQAGDACLAAIIPPIQAELRQSDVIGRYGGEEFVVILNGADSAAAHPIAQRIVDRVADVRVEGFGDPISLTCSIGVAASDTLGVWGQNLIARADAAVYAAKRSGRNRVQIAMPFAA